MANLVKQKTKTLVMSRMANFALIALIFAAVFSYIYFANTAVRALTSLEKTESMVQELSVKVSEMESKRLAVENGVNAEMAMNMGFVEAKNPIFIIKDSGKISLSMKK